MTALDRLLELLLEERGEDVKELKDIPEGERPRIFRALCNIRPPAPVSEEFLVLEREYLSMVREQKGVVDIETLNFRNGIALWQGDITRLSADAIVNACNSALLGCFQPGHMCIDNVIHSAAGVQVRLDCAALMQGSEEPNGRVKVTRGYNLPSRYIFHTVGPIVSGAVTRQNREDLKSCYVSCLDKAEEMGLHSIVFCCLSTGVFQYPSDQACSLAVATVREWLAAHKTRLRVIFDTFSDKDYELYKAALGCV